MRSTLFTAGLTLAFLLTFAVSSQNFAQTLSPGSPPLTQEMANNFAAFFEWVLGISLDPAQKEALKQANISTWARKDKAEIEGTLSILDLQAKAMQATPEARDTARAQLQPEILKTLEADPSDQVSAILLAAYRTARAASKSERSPMGDEPPAYPIAGEPPLTRDMVDNGVRLFEWLLDARLTEEQYKQFETSVRNTWTGGDSKEIADTVNILKIYAELDKKTEAERTAVRESMSSQYLDLMRSTPDAPGSKWALDIYYSAHKPIAAGNPPLTRQAADAYAEVLSFMIGEVVGDTSYKPDKEYKDLLAKSLTAQYSGLSPARQKEFSEMPLVWAAIRLGWPHLSAAEKAAFRKQWTPGVQALIPAEPTAKTADSRSATPAPGRSGQLNSNTRKALADYASHERTRRLLYNMNQDFLHQHCLSPGWTYMKYSTW